MSSQTELIVTAIFMITVSVIAMFGNALVIFAVVWNRRLRTVPNILFVNLAVADMLQGTISIPLRLAEVLNQTGRSPIVPCLAVIPLTVFSYGASNLNLTLISLDRFFCLTRPFLYHTFVTPVKVGAVIAATWLVMLLIALLPLMGWGATDDAHIVDICLFYTTLTKDYLLMLFSIVNIIVDIILVYTNFYILKIARKHIHQIHDIALHDNSTMDVTETCATRDTASAINEDLPNEQRRVTRKKMAKDRRVAIVVLITVGMFIVLTTPITVIDIIGLLGCHDCSPLILTKIAVCMVYSNACINVFIYAGYNKEMRKTWVSAFRQIRSVATGNEDNTIQET